MKIHFKNKNLQFWQRSTENVLCHYIGSPARFVDELFFLSGRLSDTTPRNKELYRKRTLNDNVISFLKEDFLRKE